MKAENGRRKAGKRGLHPSAFLEVKTVVGILMLLVASAAEGDRGAGADDRLNILWLTCEDISPTLGCYGDQYALTPHLDRLARQGVRYTHALGISGRVAGGWGRAQRCPSLAHTGTHCALPPIRTMNFARRDKERGPSSVMEAPT
jgi:hypothetical protein